MHPFLLAGVLSLCCAMAQASDTTRVQAENGELHYAGSVDQDANARVFALYDSLDRKPSTLVVTSPGGDIDAGMELGRWVHDRKLDIRVSDYCLSSCANYVFTAGARKMVGHTAIIGFHGGASSQSFTLDATYQARLDAMTPAQQEADRAELAETLRAQAEREAAFFARIGVDRAITTYGQKPRTKALLERLNFIGWTYTRQGFARFGVDGIDVTGGAWRPALAGDTRSFATLAVH